MSDTYNLERQQNIENNIDPTGKKWEIYHIKGSSLYEARPIPYNAQTTIPEEFEGRWTKHTLLTEQINLFLHRVWDKAELAAKKLERKAEAGKQSLARTAEIAEAAEAEDLAAKKTPEESLDELPTEVKEALGNLLDVEETDKE